MRAGGFQTLRVLVYHMTGRSMAKRRNLNHATPRRLPLRQSSYPRVADQTRSQDAGSLMCVHILSLTWNAHRVGSGRTSRSLG